MNRRSFVLFLALIMVGVAHAAEPKPRLIVLTDIGGDPDDRQSMVRLMTFSNEFQIEALIASAAGTPGELGSAVTRPDLIQQIVNAYGQVRANLLLHAPGYPTSADLLARIHSGNPNRGTSFVGAAHDTAGSNRIIQIVDAADPRPVFISIWGGQTDLAQALWRVKNDRGSAGLAAFVAKFRAFDINDQDSIASWMFQQFPGMWYVLSEAPAGVDKREGAYRGMYIGGDISTTSGAWLDANVRTNHGPLGALYPNATWTDPNPYNALKEGDTPSWFYFLPRGFNDPAHPEWGSWGGRYTFNESLQVYRDAQDTVGSDTRARATVYRWRPQFQAEWQARMDWCVSSANGANHSPLAVLNADAGTGIITLSAAAGAPVNLSAGNSSDPDGNTLSYKWWVYPEADTYAGTVSMSNATAQDASIAVPADAAGKTIHVILEVKDNGTPALTSFRRAIIQVGSGNPPTNPQGPIAHWTFDEASGTVANDVSGLGTAANGTLLNGVARVAGKTGPGALRFDGTDDWIDVGNPSKLQITGAMSVAAWVYIDDFEIAGRIISKQGGTTDRGWTFCIEPNGVGAFQVAANASTGVIVQTSGALPAGQWVHLAGVYEPGAALRIYVDGALNNSVTSGVPAAQRNSTLNVNIGRRGTQNLYWDGALDDIRLYARPLSGSEIQSLAATAPLQFAVTIDAVSSGRSYTLASAAVGAAYFTDRSYTISGLGSGLAGSALIRTANDDKNVTAADHLRFSVNAPARIFVAYDKRGTTLPAWLQDASWSASGEAVNTTDASASPLQVRTKTIPAGQTILGGNLAAPAVGSLSHYIVFVQPATPAPAPVAMRSADASWEHAADSDGDGLRDDYEAQAGLNPLAVDSDADGIVDEDEIASNAARTHFNSQGLGAPMSNVTVKSNLRTSRVRICGELAGLPATFSPANAAFRMEIAGTRADFILNKRGVAKSTSGSFALKTPRAGRTGPATFELLLQLPPANGAPEELRLTVGASAYHALITRK